MLKLTFCCSMGIIKLGKSDARLGLNQVDHWIRYFILTVGANVFG